jgi:hypothetical protein
MARFAGLRCPRCKTLQTLPSGVRASRVGGVKARDCDWLWQPWDKRDFKQACKHGSQAQERVWSKAQRWLSVGAGREHTQHQAHVQGRCGVLCQFGCQRRREPWWRMLRPMKTKAASQALRWLAVEPNPSLKREHQRRATRPGPRVLAHFPRPRPGVPPLAPA